MTKDEALKLGLQLIEAAESLALDSAICGNYVKEERELIQRSKIAFEEALAQSEFVLNGIDCSCGRKWRVVNNTLTASEQPEQEPDDLTAAYLSGVYDGKNKYAPQLEQEPVAFRNKQTGEFCTSGFLRGQLGQWTPLYEEHTIPLYITPPQRKPLTDEQCINQMLNSGFERNSLGWSFTYGRLDYHLLKFARAIEAAHGIKE